MWSSVLRKGSSNHYKRWNDSPWRTIKFWRFHTMEICSIWDRWGIWIWRWIWLSLSPTIASAGWGSYGQCSWEETCWRSWTWVRSTGWTRSSISIWLIIIWRWVDVYSANIFFLTYKWHDITTTIYIFHLLIFQFLNIFLFCKINWFSGACLSSSIFKNLLTA